MAKKKTSDVTPLKGPTIPLKKGIAQLEALQDSGSTLADSEKLDLDTHRNWQSQVRTWLEATLGEGDSKVWRVLNAGHHSVIDRDWPPPRMRQHLQGILRPQLDELNNVLNYLRVQVEQEEENAVIDQINKPTPETAKSRKVFIVHGHDDTAKLSLARILAKLKLDPIILHEQTNQGKTIIEKFEANADVAFAIVLMTGDDRGGTKDAKEADLQLRPRQNVVFELGYFIGKLGRPHVCVLKKDTEDVLSDISGVVYITMDPHDGWQGKLVKELRVIFPDVSADVL